MVRVNDEKELAKRYDQVHIDTKSSQVAFIFYLKTVLQIARNDLILNAHKNLKTYYIFSHCLKRCGPNSTIQQPFHTSCHYCNIVFSCHVSKSSESALLGKFTQSRNKKARQTRLEGCCLKTKLTHILFIS